jgi:hypothetical protein
MMAAAAALALAACGQQGSGPQLPPVQQGAQAPTVLTPQPGAQQASPLTAEQQEQLNTLVTSYLNDVQNQFGQGMGPAQGFTDQIAAMQPATDSRWQVNLTNGTAYRFIGACDNECSNLDIELIDMRTGGVVASDMLPDDYPVVNYTPSADGQYIVRLIMQTCTIAPCYAGARALTAGAPAADK